MPSYGWRGARDVKYWSGKKSAGKGERSERKEGRDEIGLGGEQKKGDKNFISQTCHVHGEKS